VGAAVVAVEIAVGVGIAYGTTEKDPSPSFGHIYAN
jgi:hypothetical protein